MQTSKHVTETALLCHSSPHNLINQLSSSQRKSQVISKTVSLITKISGQITAEIQENLAKLVAGNLKIIPDSKRTQTRPKQGGKTASQFCKPGDAKEKAFDQIHQFIFDYSTIKCSSQQNQANIAQGSWWGKNEREPVGKKYKI